MNKLITLVVTTVMVLAGCQATQPSDGMKNYQSLSGNVEIPENPQRIVSDYYCGDLLALNTNVVGCDLSYKSPVWDLDGVTDIGQSTEKVASLNPDLIITFNADNYEVYKTMAPTILIPYGSYNEEDLLNELAIITGTEDKAKQLLSNFNQNVAELKKVIANKYDLDTTTFSTIESWGEDAYVYGNTWSRFGYVMYDKLGLKMPQKAEGKLMSDDPAGETYLALTEELINDYIGDVVLVATADGKPDNNPIINSKAFKDTNAYKKGNLYYVKSDLFYNNDILSLEAQIKTIMDLTNE